MRMIISEAITDILQTTEIVSNIIIADFDIGSGSVKASDFDAKGDILVGTGNNAYTVLPVGSDGQKLTARSSATCGLQWENEAAMELYTVCNGRLTLTSGTPITSSDVTNSTVYFTPYGGAVIGLYYNGGWDLYEYTEKNIKITNTQNGSTVNGSPTVTGLTDTSQLVVGMEVTGTGIPASTTIAAILTGSSITISNNATATGTNALTFKVPNLLPTDIFAYVSNNDVKLGMILWANATTRATGLTTLNGIRVSSGNNGWRYLGTILCSSAGTVEDSATHRGVYNRYNQVEKFGYVRENTTHTYNGSARLWNNSTTNNLIRFVNGLIDEPLDYYAEATIKAGAAGNQGVIYPYVNGSSVTGFYAQVRTDQYVTVSTRHLMYPPGGYVYLSVYESSDHASTTFTNLRIVCSVLM